MARILETDLDERPSGHRVSVRCVDEDAEVVNGMSFMLDDPINARKLVEALQGFASDPTPSNMNWVSNRLRNVPARERKGVLAVLDRYAGRAS